MFRKLKAGATSQAIPLFIFDTSSTVGAGLGSLVYNSSGLTAKYRRQGQSSWTSITLATMTLGTWATGGFIVDSGASTGHYEFGIPDACLAASANVTWVEIELYGVTNMLPVSVFIELDLIDYQDAVRAGLTALPNGNAGTAGTGLAILDANSSIAANVTRFGGTAGAFSGGRPEVNVTHAAGTSWNSGGITANTMAAGTFAAVWTVTTRELTSGTNIVLAKGTGLTGLNDITAASVWAVGTRELTSGANIALAKGTGVTGFNDITAASVWSVGTRELTSGSNIVLAKGVGVTGFNDITATNVWAAAARTLTAFDEDDTTIDIDAALRAAMGLSTANLDTQLSDIKTKTDNLPNVPFVHTSGKVWALDDNGNPVASATAVGTVQSTVDTLPTVEEIFTFDSATVQASLGSGDIYSLAFIIAQTTNFEVDQVNDLLKVYKDSGSLWASIDLVDDSAQNPVKKVGSA